MHAYKKKDANPQKGIYSQGISIEKTGYCRGNFRLEVPSCGGKWAEQITLHVNHIGVNVAHALAGILMHIKLHGGYQTRRSPHHSPCASKRWFCSASHALCDCSNCALRCDSVSMRFAACSSENSFADTMTVSTRPSISTNTGSVLVCAQIAPKRFLI